MTSHKSPVLDDLQRWHIAAQREGLTLEEFQRRACNERAFHVLNPGTKLLAAVADTVLKFGQDETPKPPLCKCGHDLNYHSATPGTNRHGSCGKALCTCNCFEEKKATPKGRRVGSKA